MHWLKDSGNYPSQHSDAELPKNWHKSTPAYVRLTFGEKLAYWVPVYTAVGAKRGITMAAAILIWPYFGPDCAWICLPAVGGVSA